MGASDGRKDVRAKKMSAASAWKQGHVGGRGGRGRPTYSNQGRGRGGGGGRGGRGRVQCNQPFPSVLS